MQVCWVKVGTRFKTDASVAKGIVTRRGMGKARHSEENQLWIQSKLSVCPNMVKSSPCMTACGPLCGKMQGISFPRLNQIATMMF